MLIKSVDGIDIADMRGLVRAIEGGTGRYVEIRSAAGHELVLDRTVVRARSEEILERFGVPRDRSDDLEDDADGAERHELSLGRISVVP
jgi:hypothetical protein